MDIRSQKSLAAFKEKLKPFFLLRVFLNLQDMYYLIYFLFRIFSALDIVVDTALYKMILLLVFIRIQIKLEGSSIPAGLTNLIDRTKGHEMRPDLANKSVPPPKSKFRYEQWLLLQLSAVLTCKRGLWVIFHCIDP